MSEEFTNKTQFGKVKVTLEAPWYTYQKRLKALFDGDPDIVISDVDKSSEDGRYYVHITVSNHKKYKALFSLLPEAVNFGNVRLFLILYDKEYNMSNRAIDEVLDLFSDNPHINQLIEIEDAAGARHLFVQFKPEVLQFYDDNTQSYDSVTSCLAEDIATDCLEGACAGIHFCTAPVDK